MPAYLRVGQSLAKGQSLVAAKGRATLELESTGNLILRHDGVPVWDSWSQTGPVDADRLVIDSAISLRDKAGNVLWQRLATAIDPNPRELCLTDHGWISFRTTSPRWSTNTAMNVVAKAAAPAVWEFGDSMGVGFVQVGSSRLEVRLDGQLELSRSGKTVWSSNIKKPTYNSYLTVGLGPFGTTPTAELRGPGGVVTWSALGFPWYPNLNLQFATELRLQDDGNLVLYDYHEYGREGSDLPVLRPSLAELCRSGTTGHLNADGDPAISSLTPWTANDGKPVGLQPLMLVIVEPRLLEQEPRSLERLRDLPWAIGQFRDDLVADGYDARVLAMATYNGTAKQDGFTALAIRSFFQKVKTAYPNFAGVIFVGSYPEPSLVRRWMLTQKWDPAPANGETVLQCWPERVADWSDIVYADLTGRWDKLYRSSARLEYFRGVPDAPAKFKDGASLSFDKKRVEHGHLVFEDVFVVIEDQLDYQSPTSAKRTVTYRTDRRDPEVFEPGHIQANAIARPDIVVSRIDARPAAYSADSAPANATGDTWTSAAGEPRTVSKPITLPLPDGAGLIVDEPLERQLLFEYFVRNHRHRTLPMYPQQDRVVSISLQRDFAWAAPAHAAEVKAKLGLTQPSIVPKTIELDTYAWVWDQPCSIRVIHTHAGNQSTELDPSSNPPATAQNVAAYAGVPPYRWHDDGQSLVPSFQDQGPYGDFWIHRTLWNSGRRPERGSFLVHYGCETPNAVDRSRPHYNAAFARLRMATCMVFYTDVVAMTGRTKVFNDDSAGFWDGFAKPDSRFGGGWIATYDLAGQSGGSALFKGWVGAKIAYSWVLLGDWTLKRIYP